MSLFFSKQVAINESGLGLLSWWDQQIQQTEEDIDAGEEYEEWIRSRIEIVYTMDYDIYFILKYNIYF